MNLTENLSRADILTQLKQNGIIWGEDSFWDKYWEFVAQLNPDIQVSIAGKISQAEFKSEQQYTAERQVYADVNDDLAPVIDIDNDVITKLIKQGLKLNVSAKHALIYALLKTNHTTNYVMQQTGLGDRQLRRIFANVDKVVSNYVDERSDWYKIYLSETNRITRHHSITTTSFVDKEIREAREYLEEFLNTTTSYQVKMTGELCPRFLMNYANNLWILSIRQLLTLSAAIKYAQEADVEIKVYLKNNRNNWDTCLVVSVIDGVIFQTRPSLRLGKFTFSKLDRYEYEDNLVLIYKNSENFA